MSVPLLTVPEVADITRLSVWTIRRAIDAGELRAIRIRSRVRVSRVALDAWLEASTTSVRAEVPSGRKSPRRRPTHRGASVRTYGDRVRAEAREQREGSMAGPLA